MFGPVLYTAEGPNGKAIVRLDNTNNQFQVLHEQVYCTSSHWHTYSSAKQVADNCVKRLT